MNHISPRKLETSDRYANSNNVFGVIKLPTLRVPQEQASQYTDAPVALQEAGVRVKCHVHQFLGGTAIERREVSIHLEGRTEPFKCTHYHKLCWPDHGAPKETGTVREIVRAVRDVRIVHYACLCFRSVVFVLVSQANVVKLPACDR